MCCSQVCVWSFCKHDYVKKGKKEQKKFIFCSVHSLWLISFIYSANFPYSHLSTGTICIPLVTLHLETSFWQAESKDKWLF